MGAQAPLNKTRHVVAVSRLYLLLGGRAGSACGIRADDVLATCAHLGIRAWCACCLLNLCAGARDADWTESALSRMRLCFWTRAHADRWARLVACRVYV